MGSWKQVDTGTFSKYCEKQEDDKRFMLATDYSQMLFAVPYGMAMGEEYDILFEKTTRSEIAAFINQIGYTDHLYVWSSETSHTEDGDNKENVMEFEIIPSREQQCHE